MGYLNKKAKFAHRCFKKGVPRRKVYAVVEKDDKFMVLKNRPDSKYKFSLSGGGIEKREDVITAIKRELREEMNVEVDFVRRLGVITDKSKWTYKGVEFWVDDEMEIVYTKFKQYGNNTKFGLDGEFEIEDIVVEISKDEMLNNVAEFVSYGIEL